MSNSTFVDCLSCSGKVFFKYYSFPKYKCFHVFRACYKDCHRIVHFSQWTQSRSLNVLSSPTSYFAPCSILRFCRTSLVPAYYVAQPHDGFNRYHTKQNGKASSTKHCICKSISPSSKRYSGGTLLTTCGNHNHATFPKARIGRRSIHNTSSQ